MHAVINGENFHALQVLSFVYERQVDCIYIDPPYNTGASGCNPGGEPVLSRLETIGRAPRAASLRGAPLR